MGILIWPMDTPITDEAPEGSGNQPRTPILPQKRGFVKGYVLPGCSVVKLHATEEAQAGPEGKACAATPEGLGLALRAGLC